MHKHDFQCTCAGLALLILLLSVLVACTRPDSGTVIPPANPQQVFQLQGRIQQGPSAGLNLSGELRTTIDGRSAESSIDPTIPAWPSNLIRSWCWKQKRCGCALK